MRIDFPKTEQIPDLKQLWQRVFRDSDAFLDSFFALGFSPDHCLCAMEENKLLGAMYWLDHSCRDRKIAYLYAVATAPEARGQGICRNLTQQARHVLTRQGYAGIVLVPAEPGLFAMYEKLGFTPSSGVKEIACLSGKTPLSLRALGPAEYNSLRNSLLPEGSAELEAQALAFLASQAEFFTGEGWVLAAYRQKSTLTGLEYLGDSDLLPGILKALGCTQGTFRIPGTTRNFAMFAPLVPGEKSPVHLGFAFD